MSKCFWFSDSGLYVNECKIENLLSNQLNAWVFVLWIFLFFAYTLVLYHTVCTFQIEKKNRKEKNNTLLAPTITVTIAERSETTQNHLQCLCKNCCVHNTICSLCICVLCIVYIHLDIHTMLSRDAVVCYFVPTKLPARFNV